MKTKDIITLIGVSGFMTVFLAVGFGIEGIIMAIITFGIIFLMLFVTFSVEDRLKRR